MNLIIVKAEPGEAIGDFAQRVVKIENDYVIWAQMNDVTINVYKNSTYEDICEKYVFLCERNILLNRISELKRQK